ncbi:MAG: hypothetical protein AUI83_04785 [Armatimonadetes bacterium 13_1_40CM_3_65_7]|nr:MAG: hypothetical protein AUI83_04785 [Armatimonadetes bacterium 13_1_40CM_3_65_7]
MQCPKCGAENPAGKIICRVCGARLRPGSPGAASGGPGKSETDEELRRRLSYDLLRIVWVVAVVILVGLGLGLLLK